MYTYRPVSHSHDRVHLRPIALDSFLGGLSPSSVRTHPVVAVLGALLLLIVAINVCLVLVAIF